VVKLKLTVSPCEEYPRHELHIQDWLAKEKGIYNQFKSDVVILKSTEKALQITLKKSGEEHWIPKSQCKIIERNEEPLSKWWSK
jgi:hypothetical protein